MSKKQEWATQMRYDFSGVESLVSTLRLAAERIEFEFPQGYGFYDFKVVFNLPSGDTRMLSTYQGGSSYVTFRVAKLPSGSKGGA